MSRYLKGVPSNCAKVLIALSHVLTPQSEDLVLDGVEEVIIRNANKLIREFPTLFRLGFIFGIRLFEWLPFLFGFGLRRFSKLSSKHQRGYVDNWAESRFIPKREFFKTLRTVVMIGFFSDKRVWTYVGYDPEPHLAQRIQMRKDLLAKQRSEGDENKEEREGIKEKVEGISYKV